MNTTCLYLSEARSRVPPPTYPRLHSLRSLSLGLLRTSLSEAINHCRLEDGDKPHPYIGSSRFNSL